VFADRADRGRPRRQARYRTAAQTRYALGDLAGLVCETIRLLDISCSIRECLRPVNKLVGRTVTEISRILAMSVGMSGHNDVKDH
jgi:hypothetical protein